MENPPWLAIYMRKEGTYGMWEMPRNNPGTEIHRKPQTHVPTGNTSNVTSFLYEKRAPSTNEQHLPHTYGHLHVLRE